MSYVQPVRPITCTARLIICVKGLHSVTWGRVATHSLVAVRAAHTLQLHEMPGYKNTFCRLQCNFQMNYPVACIHQIGAVLSCAM